MNRCSFCGKKQGEVRLIAGPGVFICQLCVALCNEILAQDTPAPGQPERPGKRPQPEPGGSDPLVRTEISSARPVLLPEIANS